MVPRLTSFVGCLILAGAASLLIVLSACVRSTQPAPLVVRDFCSLTKEQLPLLLSRKDSDFTKLQAAQLNETHKRLCKASSFERIPHGRVYV